MRRAVTCTTPLYATHNAHSWDRGCRGAALAFFTLPPPQKAQECISQLYSGEATAVLQSPPPDPAPLTCKNYEKTGREVLSLPASWVCSTRPQGGGCHMLRAPALKPRPPGFESQHCDPGRATLSVCAILFYLQDGDGNNVHHGSVVRLK